MKIMEWWRTSYFAQKLFFAAQEMLSCTIEWRTSVNLCWVVTHIHSVLHNNVVFTSRKNVCFPFTFYPVWQTWRSFLTNLSFCSLIFMTRFRHKNFRLVGHSSLKRENERKREGEGCPFSTFFLIVICKNMPVNVIWNKKASLESMSTLRWGCIPHYCWFLNTQILWQIQEHSFFIWLTNL
jgi:hypothetical protein